jgi:hypothetical protein
VFLGGRNSTKGHVTSSPDLLVTMDTKPCYPRYFFNLFMPKMSTLWVILPGVESFFTQRWILVKMHFSKIVFLMYFNFFACISTFSYSISYTHKGKDEMHEKDDF